MEWSWLILALIPVAWFIQNCAHEGSHLTTAWFAYGLKPLAFWPFPHKYKGRWYFARCTTVQPKTLTPDVYIAPLLFNVPYLISLLIGALLLWSHLNILFLIPFVAAPIIDTLFWGFGYYWGSSETDGKKYRACQ